MIWVSSEEKLKARAANRRNLAKLADPRGRSDAEIADVIRTTRPHYHFMGGAHSGETGPSEMLMELVYRLATETSPVISQIRNNRYVSVTPVADADGQDRNVDWFLRNLENGLSKPLPPKDTTAKLAATTPPTTTPAPGRVMPPVPYWGRYAYHDNNRDINPVLSSPNSARPTANGRRAPAPSTTRPAVAATPGAIRAVDPLEGNLKGTNDDIGIKGASERK